MYAHNIFNTLQYSKTAYYFQIHYFGTDASSLTVYYFNLSLTNQVLISSILNKKFNFKIRQQINVNNVFMLK